MKCGTRTVRKAYPERKPTDCVPQCSRRHRRPDSGEVARKTADFKSSGRHAGRKNTSDGQSPREEILHEEHAAGDRHTTEEAVTEITEDFDLRKAVIYSEVLKPKFNEE